MLPKGYKTVVDWFQEVAEDPEYVNPVFARFDSCESDEGEEEDTPGINFNRVEGVEKIEENSGRDVMA